MQFACRSNSQPHLAVQHIGTAACAATVPKGLEHAARGEQPLQLVLDIGG